MPENSDKSEYVQDNIKLMARGLYRATNAATDDPGQTASVLSLAMALVACRDVLHDCTKEEAVASMLEEFAGYVDQLWDDPVHVKARFRDMEVEGRA